MGNLVTNNESMETKLQTNGNSYVRLFTKSNSKRLSSISLNVKC